jgi:hypothetical protein
MQLQPPVMGFGSVSCLSHRRILLVSRLLIFRGPTAYFATGLRQGNFPSGSHDPYRRSTPFSHMADDSAA